MNENTFWEVINYSKELAGWNKVEQEKILIEKLSEYSDEDIATFQHFFNQFLEKADRWNVMAAYKIIEGWVTDDPWYYFRCWLIAQGSKVFFGTLENPDFLVNCLDETHLQKYDSANVHMEIYNIGFNAYSFKHNHDSNITPYDIVEAKVFKNLPILAHSHTEGDEWETLEDAAIICPLLYQKFIGKNAIEEKDGLMQFVKNAVKDRNTTGKVDDEAIQQMNKMVEDMLAKLNNTY